MESTRKKRLIYIGITVLVIAGLLVVFMLSSNQAQTFNPNQQVEAGQNIVVTVKADTLDAMYGYQFRLNYNPDDWEYTGTLTSKVQEITNIFSKQKDGYELVGATMVGQQSGITGKNKVLCEMVFTAKKDGTLGDFPLTLSNVNVVKPDSEYLENIEGWQCLISVQS